MFKHAFVLVLFIGISLPCFLQAQSTRKKVLEGNQLFSEERFDEANNKYQDALLDDPASTEIQFNVGGVQYKKSDFEKALESYQKALDSDDPLFQSRSYYNMGNTLYRAGKMPESVLAYEQALKLNPDDEDAKFNLEFVRNKMKENAQPQEQNQQQQQQQQQQNQQEQEKKDQENQEEEQQEQQEEQQAQQQPEEKKELSKEEAERLLEALKEKQEEMKKQKAQSQGRARVAKDW